MTILYYLLTFGFMIVCFVLNQEYLSKSRNLEAKDETLSDFEKGKKSAQYIATANFFLIAGILAGFVLMFLFFELHT